MIYRVLLVSHLSAAPAYWWFHNIYWDVIKEKNETHIHSIVLEAAL